MKWNELRRNQQILTEKEARNIFAGICEPVSENPQISCRVRSWLLKTWSHWPRMWFYCKISELSVLKSIVKSPKAVWQCDVIIKTSFYSFSSVLLQFPFHPLAFLCESEAVSRLYGSVYKHVCVRGIFLWACDLPTAQWGFRFGKRERGCFGNG